MPDDLQPNADADLEKVVCRTIARLGSTNEIEVSVATKRKASEVRRAFRDLEEKKLIRRGSSRSRHFGESIELTGLGRRSL